VINVPQDKGDYGEFSDYGYYSGKEWAGYDNLPPGYWVYVSPNWYIWGKQGGQPKGAAKGLPLNPESNPRGLTPAQAQEVLKLAAANPANAKASANGKYNNLLKVITVPQDQATYGEFNDYGFWGGTEWAGFQNLPQGYWVYVAPNWYIWGGLAPQPGAVPPGAGGGVVPAQASVNGKYSDLLKVINVPGDQASYGQFNDWGHWTGTSWAGHNNLPPGYWVYVAPNWYIWGKQGAAQPQPNPPANPGGQDQVKASVNGKYSKLLRVINVPQDQGAYGAFNDYGYYTGTSWAGYNNLPVGYWVYVAPNWYIWGESK
jgi:hypothetical protein